MARQTVKGAKTINKLIEARLKGVTIAEAAEAAGVTKRHAEHILCSSETKAKIARQFADSNEARSYCHRRIYERIGALLDDDDHWQEGMALFQGQAEKDAKVMATLQPQLPAPMPGVAIQFNGAGSAGPVTLDELMRDHRPVPQTLEGEAEEVDA